MQLFLLKSVGRLIFLKSRAHFLTAFSHGGKLKREKHRGLTH